MMKVWGVKLTYALRESDSPARYRRENQRSSCQTELFLLFEKIIPGRLTGEEMGGGGCFCQTSRWDAAKLGQVRWREKIKLRQKEGDKMFFSILEVCVEAIYSSVIVLVAPTLATWGFKHPFKRWLDARRAVYVLSSHA